MQVHPTVHPSADVLKAFGLGKLDDTSADVLMNHLDQCADCRKVVASQSGDDFLKRLRQVHTPNSTPAPAKSLTGITTDVAQLPGRPTPLHNLPPELAEHPQYEILRELGHGGMGVVYLAQNKPMDRLEVLKVINKTLLDRSGSVERFLREIRSAAKLNHANVVAAYSVLQAGELLAFAMEYVEGQDLAALVKAQGPLPVPHACFYVQQAALGLQHAFEKGMVHRDIKPHNLILARENRKHLVKVLDFGLAKVIREKTEDTGLTGEGKMLGTPDYIAPEQTLDAASADIRADIYSLGCTLYYLLTGAPPFSGASLGAILLAHQMQEAKLLNLLRPEVAEELAAVVRKMMAKDRAKRYQTPLEVVQALRPFVKAGAVPKSPPALSVAVPRAAGVKAVKADRSLAPAAEGEQRKATVAEASSPVAKDVPAKDAAASAFEGLAEAVVSTKKAKPARKAAKPVPRAWYRRWPVLAGVGTGMLALALGAWLLAGIVFKTKVKTANGEAFVVLEIDQPDAEVVVDGQKISVQVPGDNKPIEIQVEPGRPHKLRVRKDGFEVVSRDVELKSGKSAPIRVRLEPVKAAGEAAKPVLIVIVCKEGKGHFSSLREAVREAPAGSRLLVRPGRYQENVVIRKPLELVLEADDAHGKAVIESSDDTALRLLADGIKVRGFTLLTTAPKDMKKPAVEIARGKGVVLENCDIVSHSHSGLSIHGSATEVMVRHCKSHDSKNSGTDVFAGGKGTFEDSQFAGNSNNGAEIAFGGTAVFRRCQMRANSQGTCVQVHAQATFVDCVFTENKTGMLVCNDAKVDLRHCQLHANEFSGVHTWNKAQLQLTDCDIFKNPEHGIATWQSQTILAGCRINRNKGWAVLANDGSTGRVEDCDLTGNGQGPLRTDQGSQLEKKNNKE